MADTLFHGGPCDGSHYWVPDKTLATGTVTCKGTAYKVYDVGGGEWLALLPEAAPPSSTGASQPPVGASAPTPVRAPGAWDALMRALSRSLPTNLEAARDSSRRIGRL